MGFGSPGLNGSGLWFFFRHVPSCRKGKKATVPCDVALPCRAGGAAGVRVRRCLPCGQRRCRVARRILACREKTGFRCVLPIRKLPPARRGTGERASPRKGRSLSRTPSAPRSPNEPFPARNGDTPHLTDETSPFLLQNLPLYPSAANAALYKPRLIAPAFCGEHAARAQAQLSAPAKGYLSALPATSSPVIPPPRTPQADGPCSWAVRRVCALPPEQKRNEAPMPLLVGHGRVNTEPTALAADTVGPAGSARTRSRVQTLENPFLGERPRFSPLPVPQNRRRRTAPARGPSAVYALCRRNRNETKHPSPLLVGLGCVYSPPKALAGGTAAPLLVRWVFVYTAPKALTGDTVALPASTCRPCRRRRRGWRPVLARECP